MFSGGSATNIFSYIGSTNGYGNANDVTTSSLDTTGANLVVIGVASYTVYPIPVITDSYSNTWTALTDYDAVSNSRYTLFYSINPTVGTGHTFTATSVINTTPPFTPPVYSAYPAINVIAFASTGTPSFDKETGNGTYTGSTADVGPITPVQDNSLIITGVNSWKANASASINSGFTVTTSNGYNPSVAFGSAAAYLIQTTAAAINPIWTFNTTTDGTGIGIAVFKP